MGKQCETLFSGLGVTGTRVGGWWSLPGPGKPTPQPPHRWATHRIGRTARSTNKGTAYTFFTPGNLKQARELIKVLEEANQAINPKLMQLVDHRGGGGGGGKGKSWSFPGTAKVSFWKDPLEGRAWQPTPVFLPGESCGQRSLAGYSP